MSDHTPLFVDSSEAAHVGNKMAFSFEFSWFKREGFVESVASEWAKENSGSTNVEWWLYKIKLLWQFLWHWAKNVSGFYKVEKERLICLIDELDIKAEATPLLSTECVAKRKTEENLAKLLRRGGC